MSAERVKITPGPWEVSSSGRFIDPVGEGAPICQIIAEGNFLTYAANAQAISALPDLLRVCAAFVEAEDELLADLRATGELPDLTERPWTLVDDMRAALAKAAGDRS